MLKKTLNLEDEHEIPAEENNCFGFDREAGKCAILTATKLTDADKLNCGTIRCKFYKPDEHANSIKHVTKEGMYFETREEYLRRTGYEYLTQEDIKQYENFPHASPEVVEEEYKTFIKEKNSPIEIEMVLAMLPHMTKAQIIQKGSEYGIFINSGLRRSEMSDILEEGLCEFL